MRIAHMCLAAQNVVLIIANRYLAYNTTSIPSNQKALHQMAAEQSNSQALWPKACILGIFQSSEQDQCARLWCFVSAEIKNSRRIASIVQLCSCAMYVYICAAAFCAVLCSLLVLPTLTAFRWHLCSNS